VTSPFADEAIVGEDPLPPVPSLVHLYGLSDVTAPPRYCGRRCIAALRLSLLAAARWRGLPNQGSRVASGAPLI